jgi:hypothetical protein
MKLCKDCEHYVKSNHPDVGKCVRVEQPVSPVSGNPIDPPYCSVERSHNWLWARLFRACGHEARYFQLRPVTKSPWRETRPTHIGNWLY